MSKKTQFSSKKLHGCFNGSPCGSGKNINNVVVNNHEILANKGFARVFNFLEKINILQKVHFRYDFTYDNHTDKSYLNRI